MKNRRDSTLFGGLRSDLQATGTKYWPKYTVTWAMGIELWNEPLTPEERDQLVNEVVEQVGRRGLHVPAVLLLEMHRPFFNLASQAMIVSTPFTAPFFGMERIQGFGRLMADREGMEQLIQRLEDDANGAKESA